MPSPFSLGVQNASAVFELFADGDVTFFTVSQTTAETVSNVAHGLSGTPDFVFISESAGGIGANQEGVTWSAGATTITFTAVDTQAPKTIAVICANLS